MQTKFKPNKNAFEVCKKPFTQNEEPPRVSYCAGKNHDNFYRPPFLLLFCSGLADNISGDCSIMGNNGMSSIRLTCSFISLLINLCSFGSFPPMIVTSRRRRSAKWGIPFMNL